MSHKQNTASQYDRDLEICEELRSKFTANAEEFDSLMVRMLEMNTQLIKKAQRCEELEKALAHTRAILSDVAIEHEDLF